MFGKMTRSTKPGGEWNELAMFPVLEAKRTAYSSYMLDITIKTTMGLSRVYWTLHKVFKWFLCA